MDKYQIRLAFNEGTEGIVYLSDIAGKGVFTWDNLDIFSKVFVDKESGAIAWPGNLDIDTLNRYPQIKGLTYRQYKMRTDTISSPLSWNRNLFF